MIKLLSYPNKLASSFILNLISGSILLNLIPHNLFYIITLYLFNFLFIYILQLVAEKIAIYLYKPDMIDKDHMSLEESMQFYKYEGSASLKIYNDKEYKIRYENSLQFRVTGYSLFLYFIILSILSYANILALNNFNGIILNINYTKALQIFIIFLFYLAAYYTGSIWQYDKENNIQGRYTKLYLIFCCLFYIIIFINIANSIIQSRLF